MIKQLLREGLNGVIYENKINTLLGEGPSELVRIFRSFNKLSGNLTEDTKYIGEFYKLLTEEEDFDPFGHLDQTGKIDVEEDCVLTISPPNSKLGQINAPSFSLPAGYTCPFADICKSIAHRKGEKAFGGKAIKDMGSIRCYAASAEVAYPAVRKMRWRNFDLLQDTMKKGGVRGMTELLVRSLAYYEQSHGHIKLFRIHDSGDFFNIEYLDSWIETAKARPDVLFYAYTKSLPFWKERKNAIPKNLRLIASEGGKADELIGKEGFRKAVIVKDKGEAIAKRLNVDVNDFLAAFGDKDFALLLHGVQSAKSGDTKQAMANSKLVKSAAANFNTSPAEIEKILKIYTN